MNGWLIRNAQEKDSAGIARLASQLGYPADESQVRVRLRRIFSSSNDLVLVAEFANGEIAGWIHGFFSQLLESDFRVEIGGLVVDEKFHRRGIAQELVRRIEAWAIENSATQVSVRCSTTRLEAHKFYENSGFFATKTQIVFRKHLR